MGGERGIAQHTSNRCKNSLKLVLSLKFHSKSPTMLTDTVRMLRELLRMLKR